MVNGASYRCFLMSSVCECRMLLCNVGVIMQVGTCGSYPGLVCAVPVQGAWVHAGWSWTGEGATDRDVDAIRVEDG